MASEALAREPRTLSGKVTLTIRRVLIYIALGILTLMCLFPIWILLVNMTRTHGQISTKLSFWFGTNLVENTKNALAQTNVKIGQSLLNSLFISFFSSLLCVYFSALTAYAIHIYNFKGKEIIFNFILLIMMIPTQVSALGFIQMVTGWETAMSVKNQFWPLILPSISSPVTFFFMKQYLEATLPYELVEAGRVDGANELKIFHFLVLPIMLPALAVQFIFAFVGSWNNLFVPSMLLNGDITRETIPMVIAKFTDSSNPINFDLGQVYVAMGYAVLPPVLVYLIFSRFIIKGMTAGAVKG
jgi:multiple sugar transport system permease protein